MLILKEKHISQITLGALTFLSFAIPFGIWQEQLLFGLTAAKIIVPMSTILFACMILQAKSQPVYIYKGWVIYLTFILLISPTLLLAGSLGFAHFLLFSGYGILMLLMFNICQNLEHIKSILYAFLCGVSFIVIFLALAYFRIYDVGLFFSQPIFENVFGLWRLMGTENNPNAFAVFMAIALPLSVMALCTENKPYLKVLWVFFSIICLLALSMTASRSAAMGAFIGLNIIFFLKDKISLRKTILFIAMLPICVTVAFQIPNLIVYKSNYAWADQYDSITVYYEGKAYTTQERLLKDKKASIRNRLEFIPVASDIIVKNPLNGIEYRKISSYLKNYQVSQTGPHNILLDIGIYFGIPALISFMVFLGIVLIQGLHVILKTPVGEARTIYATLFAVSVTLLINGLFHTSYISNLFWLFIALNLTFIRHASQDCAFRVYPGKNLAKYVFNRPGT